MNALQASAVVPPTGPKLRDIHLPPDPSWWPPAPGWWILAGLLLLVVAVGFWLWRRRRRVVVRRLRVLRQVDRLAEQQRRDGDRAAMAAGLHQLLRRVARQHDSNASSQSGVAWRRTLARMPLPSSVIDRLFALDELMYRASPSFDDAMMVSDAKAWLRIALKPSAWKVRVEEQADA